MINFKIIDNLGNYKTANGKICLVRCPKCKQENYAFNVAEGICAWCGFDTNADKDKVKDEQ